MIELISMDFNGYAVPYFLNAEGEPWWPISGPAHILGYQDIPQVLDRLKDRDKKRYRIPIMGNRTRSVWCISEGGLYLLILRSEKPDAEAFTEWITHEVLPTIRRTGKYELTPAELNTHFLGPAPLSWEKRFELEFFQAICAVYQQPIPTDDKHSPMCASFIATYIYGIMPASVREEMDRLNPIVNKSNGRRRLRLHQLLRLERIGDFLVKRIEAVMHILLVCRRLGKDTFVKLMDEHDRAMPLQLTFEKEQTITVTLSLPYQPSLFDNDREIA
jgi:prophage antirepressor-like protein